MKPLHPDPALSAFTAYRAAYVRALAQCDMTRADAALRGCARAADAADAKPARIFVQLMTVGRLLAEADFAEAEVRTRRMREFTEDLHAEKLRLAVQSYALSLFGLRSSLRELCDRVESTFQAVIDAPAYGGAVDICVARLLALDGQFDRAAPLSRRVLEGQWFPNAPHTYGDLGLLCHLGEVCCLLGDKAGAAAVGAQLAPYARWAALLPNFSYVGSVAQRLADIDLLLGRKRAATAMEALAADLATRLRLPPAQEALRTWL